jgi:hypothetical protein
MEGMVNVAGRLKLKVLLGGRAVGAARRCATTCRLGLGAAGDEGASARRLDTVAGRGSSRGVVGVVS